MNPSVLFLYLISYVSTSCSSLQPNLTIPEMFYDLLDASESELSSQLQEIDERSSGWSTWSAWSACSRSCDGGVAHQLRTCRIGPCRGDHVRYKICNMQAFVVVAFFLASANAHAYYPSTKIIQGPSSKTTLVGPEGSVISAVAPGGQIIHEEHPGYIAHAAPVATYAAHAPLVAHSEPYVAHAAPVATYAAHAPLVAHAEPYVAHAAPVVAYAAPVSLGHETHISKYGSHINHGSPSLYSSPYAYGAYGAHAPFAAHHGVADTVVSGPSGTIATGHSLVAPYHGHSDYGHGGHGLSYY